LVAYDQQQKKKIHFYLFNTFNLIFTVNVNHFNELQHNYLDNKINYQHAEFISIFHLYTTYKSKDYLKMRIIGLKNLLQAKISSIIFNEVVKKFDRADFIIDKLINIIFLLLKILYLFI